MDLPPQIQTRLDTLGILAADVEERFVRGSGAGGQKINKTSSTVCLKHRPSEIEVRVQRERSQSANREIAWELLCDKLEEQVRVAVQQRRDQLEKTRRHKRTRSKAQKARLVASKRHRAGVKTKRGRVSDE